MKSLCYGTCIVALSAALGLAAEPKTQVVLSGLDNPCGVAIQPRTGSVFVSDSAAGQIVMVKDGKGVPVVTGFPQDIYGKGPMYNIGPLGLKFMGPRNLVVGGGGHPDGQELVYIFAMNRMNKAQKADDAAHKLGPIGPGEDSPKGEGNFYGVAVTPTAIYTTSNGDDTKGWVLKAEVKDNEPGKLTPFLKTKEATGVDAPVGITISRDGKLVISQMGEMNVPQDSLLTVYDPKSGNLELKAETGLFDIADLAYSPKTGKLYAVDFAWMDTAEGGLFELQVSMSGGQATVKANKIVSLDKPTAMAFAEDGSLYVTVFGTAAEGSEAKPGQLIKITGDL